MSSIYRFADLTFDAGRQSLQRGADPIHLGPLTYRLLLALIESAPNVIDHEELAESVWDGRTISSETISQRVKLLRDALGDDAHDPCYIELVRGRGYRLIPTVTAGSPDDPGKGRRARVAVVGIILALAAAVLIWQLAAPPTTPGRQLSVAVLPFADMSPGQDNGYFADGMAEEILNELSTTTPLRVIARTSSFAFKDRNDDIAAISRKLDVSHVVEGSVRRSGDRVRVAVQLVSAADGAHVWSESYDSELVDILRLQGEIARSVAAALEVKLLGQAKLAHSPAQRVNPEAYDLYLHGRQRLHAFALGDAERFLEQSLAIDPEFIPTYTSLGDAYVLRILDVQVPLTEYREKLRDLVGQALERAPDDAGVIGLSGQVARYDGNITLAEKRFRRALEQDPTNLVAQMLYCMFKADQGYPKACDAQAQFYRQIDPLNPILFIGEWSRSMDLWNPEAALKAADRYEEITTAGDTGALGQRAMTKLVLLGDIAGAVRELERQADIVTEGAAQSHTSPMFYYELGDLDKGDAALDLFQGLYPDLGGRDLALANRHLVTGKVAEARELLLPFFTERRDSAASYRDTAIARLAVDALIDSGEAARAVEIIDSLAPEYASYRTQEHMDPGQLSPAPFPVKSVYSSYPALYFPDYVRALRAAGNATGAENMLNHLDAILQWRREQGLFIEERHVAEARALRGDRDGALDALEQAERDRTIYNGWHVFLLHNPIFSDLWQRPRFKALIKRVRGEMDRQRREMSVARSPAGD